MKSILIALALATLSLTASAAGEVSLLKVESILAHPSNTVSSGRFEVLVANLAYTKQVNIHMKKADGTWADFPLAYNRPASSGLEVWAANFNNLNPLPTGTDPLVFAVSYCVNGQTYWDNNGGANYTITRDAGTFLKGVNVYNASFAPSAYVQGPYFTLNGHITVKSLTGTKQINVVYSTDGWKTTRSTAAYFSSSFWQNATSYATNPNSYGFEEWNFMLDVGATATRVDYAISYTVNGQTYWDNNFGQNYTTQLAPGY